MHWHYLKKLRIALSCDPEIPLPGLSPKEVKQRLEEMVAHPCSQQLSFTAAEGGSTCPSVDEWIHKTWSTYTMEYYSALKRKEIMTQAAMWMSLGDIMLSEIRQT